MHNTEEDIDFLPTETKKSIHNMNTTDLKSFHYLENGDIQFSMFETKKSSIILDSGFYETIYNGVTRMVDLKVMTNLEEIKIYDFPDKEKLDELFEAFFDGRVISSINDLGFHHKVGVLLHGKEGTGKSTIIKYYCDLAIKTHNALVFYVDDLSINMSWELIKKIRNIQDNPIIVIFEELDQHIRNNGEGLIKTMLDGNLSINNCIFFGTTNYNDNIPSAIKNRPSRFKYNLNIGGVDNVEDIKNLLSKMLKDRATPEELNTFADGLRGKTLDNIKQFALDKLMDIKTYSNETTKIGFVH